MTLKEFLTTLKEIAATETFYLHSKGTPTLRDSHGRCPLLCVARHKGFVAAAWKSAESESHLNLSYTDAGNWLGLEYTDIIAIVDAADTARLKTRPNLEKLRRQLLRITGLLPKRASHRSTSTDA